MNKDLQIAKKTVQTEINALKKLSSSFARSSLRLIPRDPVYKFHTETS